MSVARLAFLGVLSVSVAVGAACGGTVQTQENGSTTGSGGAVTSGTSTVSSTAASTTSSSSGIVDAGPEKYPAPFPTPPQVTNFGGGTLANPIFVPVFFAGDDSTYVSALSDFTAKVGATNYWNAAVSEYGVGPATSAPPIMLTEMGPATIDDTGIQTWLATKFAGSMDPDAGFDGGPDPAWPQPDANTVYVLYYPAATTITLQGSTSCNQFGGYHSDTVIDTPLGSVDVSYAVVPRCTNFPPFTGVDAITSTASHELAEASTDPRPMNQPVYAQVDDAFLYWERLLGGGEVGDMCAQFQNAFYKFSELPYAVQRIWSNKNAKAGHDPCQPELPNEVYFNAAPVLTQTITSSFQGQTISVKGVDIAVGQSKTIEVELFSEGPTAGPWTVTAKDANAAFGGSPALDVSLDKTSGQNGDKLNLTIKVMTAGKHGTETFIVESSMGGQQNLWFGIVGSPPDGG